MGDEDHTSSNAGYHGGADERQPMPNLQLPSDYYGVEGTWDEHGNWKGGTIHNPLHDVPIPGSLDPSQVLPHHSGPAGPNLMALTEHQKQHLYATRQQLTEAISLLQNATTREEIVQHLPTVLTIGNAVVHGDAHWEHQLATSCHTWIGTQPDAGTDDQFHQARDAVIHAAWQLSGEVDRWIHQNDQIMMSTQGSIALQHLATEADRAHLLLHPN
jgi:hypothetical protein